MVEPINLNKVRKTRAKLEAQAGAAENRVRFGRTKAERVATDAEAEKRRRDLDGSKREP